MSSNVERRTSTNDRQARREIANYNERRRMKSINDGFDNLKDLLPVDGEKTSKAAILQHASDYIQYLLKREKLMQDEIDMLRSAATPGTVPTQTLRAMPMQFDIRSQMGTMQMPTASIGAGVPVQEPVSVAVPVRISPSPSPSPSPEKKRTLIVKRRKSVTKCGKRTQKSTDKGSRSLDLMLAAIDSLERSNSSHSESDAESDNQSESSDTAPVLYTQSQMGLMTPDAMSSPRMMWPPSSKHMYGCKQLTVVPTVAESNATRRLQLGH